ncbi:SDR family oxidoreductase [Clostridium sp. AL.422]|uniref:SDR family oxidoreductase n=1 Tax=Clostridium TaxID=1485 RepID=UPI00293DAB53|nr:MULTISPECIES: SDR family oxidoreductase [unclassified Clostridium]MDV4151827.1 SDR family oxidoreductase [Clostridium sp. AL.422]
MKNVVITGSTRGLGFEMAKKFLNLGCNVTISGSKPESYDNAKEKLNKFNEKHIYITCNVRNKEDIRYLWRKSVEKWGSVDIWINNAGQNCPREYIWDTPDEYIDAVVDTNIKGVMYGSKIAAENMIKQGKGQIWNMEGLGSNDMVIEQTILYGTSKRALTYFTKAMAKELKDSPVKIGRLSPGMMLTDFITKSPTGEVSSVTEDDKFKKIFNTLADNPETVAEFFVPRILSNTKQDAHLVWLTNMKSAKRFMISPFNKRKLLK